MTGTNRAVDISYYEELGVASDASAEEIRNSFRSLVRMLHPDQQTDAQMKEVAERQMRKLNRIYSVLSDPARRRRYDELLEDEQPRLVVEPVADDGMRRVIGRSVWAGAGLVGASLLLWLWLANSGAPPARPRVNADGASSFNGAIAGSAQTAPASTEVARLRADLRSVTAQRDAAMRELARLRGSDPGPDPADSALAALPSASPSQARPALASLPAMTELPAAPARLAPLAAVSRSTSQGVAGFWFYVKPPQGQQNKNHALYPPEFIEATITEANGVVQGKYRSRFQIVDRAISPDVNFSFNGPSSAPSFNWTGPGGAKGEITLRLAAENQLRVDWTASDLGSQQGLSSGTAVLKRRID